MDAVLNWIWQGSAVALVTAIALAIIERSRGRDRYLTVWAALVSVLALPFVPHAWDAAATPAVAGPASSPAHAFLLVPATWWTSNTAVLLLWALWSGVSAARLALAALSLRRVKAASSCIADARQARLAHWTAVKAGGRHALLTVSRGVRSAAVLGGVSPTIAIAPALFEQLSDEDLDRIVIHEWAHVQRRDDLAHLLQSCIRVIAGWHPGVWWLERQLRIEREIACDELAVAVTGSAKGYAATLLKLASLPAVCKAPVPELAAVAPIGLRRRIARILSSDRRTSGWPWKLAAAGAGGVLFVLSATLGDVRAIEAAVIAEVREIPRALARTGPDQPSRTSPTSLPVAAPASSGSSRRQLRQSSTRDLLETSPGGTPLPTPRSPSAPAAPSVEDIGASRLPVAFSAGAPHAVMPSSVVTGATPLVPWRAVASESAAAGIALGQDSRDAAVATANYFTRLGRRIAGSF